MDLDDKSSFAWEEGQIFSRPNIWPTFGFWCFLTLYLFSTLHSALSTHIIFSKHFIPIPWHLVIFPKRISISFFHLTQNKSFQINLYTNLFIKTAKLIFVITIQNSLVNLHQNSMLFTTHYFQQFLCISSIAFHLSSAINSNSVSLSLSKLNIIFLMIHGIFIMVISITITEKFFRENRTHLANKYILSLLKPTFLASILITH